MGQGMGQSTGQGEGACASEKRRETTAGGTASVPAACAALCSLASHVSKLIAAPRHCTRAAATKLSPRAIGARGNTWLAICCGAEAGLSPLGPERRAPASRSACAATASLSGLNSATGLACGTRQGVTLATTHPCNHPPLPPCRPDNPTAPEVVGGGERLAAASGAGRALRSKGCSSPLPSMKQRRRELRIWSLDFTSRRHSTRCSGAAAV